MKLVFKHEAPIAGNASVTETYELTQEELLPMIRRDRALRAAAEHRDEEELEFRAPQCILQELECRRACGALLSPFRSRWWKRMVV